MPCSAAMPGGGEPVDRTSNPLIWGLLLIEPGEVLQYPAIAGRACRPHAKTMAKARIERRLGPKTGKLPKRLTHPLTDAPHPTEHRVQFYLKAAAEMGVNTSKAEFFSPVGSPPANAKPKVLLVPESDFGPSHEWLLDRWLELGHALAEMPCTWTVGHQRQDKGRGLDAGP